MRRGKMDRKAVFQRLAVGGRSTLNEPQSNWVLLFEAWAGRQDLSDGERVKAGVLDGFIVARFTIDFCSQSATLSTDDRVICDGRTWNILGVKEVPGARNRHLEVRAQTANGLPGN